MQINYFVMKLIIILAKSDWLKHIFYLFFISCSNLECRTTDVTICDTLSLVLRIQPKTMGVVVLRCMFYDTIITATLFSEIIFTITKPILFRCIKYAC